MKKNHYYIGVITPDGVRFVTDIKNKTRCALWEKDGIPQSFTKTVCDDIVFGLCMNFHFAFTACFPYELTCQPEKAFVKVGDAV